MNLNSYDHTFVYTLFHHEDPQAVNKRFGVFQHQKREEMGAGLLVPDGLV